MKWAVIGTWKMAEEGVRLSAEILKNGGTCGDAAVAGVSYVEDEPGFHSVGYGGRPDKNGRVFLDGGFMDGDTLHFGGVASIEGFASPVKIARSLIRGDANNLLVGQGAEQYALEHGFERRDNLTKEAEEIYLKEKESRAALAAYDGHDTVCFLAKDSSGSLCAATSTSGLFMKEPGRAGDTAFPGNGYYADSKVGAAAATGMGEEIMKGALSFAAVMYMKEGLSAMEAAQKAVNTLDAELTERNGYAQHLTVIAMDKDGNYGVGTNKEFAFAYASDEKELTMYTAVPENGKLHIAEIADDSQTEKKE